MSTFSTRGGMSQPVDPVSVVVLAVVLSLPVSVLPLDASPLDEPPLDELSLESLLVTSPLDEPPPVASPLVELSPESPTVVVAVLSSLVGSGGGSVPWLPPESPPHALASTAAKTHM